MPELMALLLDGVPEGCMLRVGMTNPPYILQHLPAIAKLLNHPRCYAFLHVPVQSGSDAVLKGMNREYTRAEFCAVADYLFAEVPNLTLATDIICGFPGETEADHDGTLQLVSKYKFSVLNISQFYPRQGTPAARMTRVNTAVVKERTREVSQLFASYQTLGYLLNTEQQVLVTEVAHDGVSLVAHTKAYVQVLLPHEPTWMGCTLRVRISEVAKFYVRGEMLEVLHAAPNEQEAAKVYEQAAKQRKARPPSKGAAAAAAASKKKKTGGELEEEAEPQQKPQQKASSPAGVQSDCEGGGCGKGGGCGEADCCMEQSASGPVAATEGAIEAMPNPEDVLGEMAVAQPDDLEAELEERPTATSAMRVWASEHAGLVAGVAVAAAGALLAVGLVRTAAARQRC